MKETGISILLLFLAAVVSSSGCIWQEQNMTQSEVLNETLPLALKYNKTKSIENATENITIKGKIIFYDLSKGSIPRNFSEEHKEKNNKYPILSEKFSSYNSSIPLEWMASSNFTNNTSITIIFYKENPEYEYVGDWVSQETGKVIPGYRQAIDIIVVYWPEKKVAGWVRFIGDSPVEEFRAPLSITKIFGPDPGPKAMDWIESHYSGK